MAGGVNLGGEDDEGISDINVTPLVDIMLVLLIVFMVTATYIVKPAIEVELPKAASGGETVEQTLSIVVSSDGELFLNGEPTTLEAIGARCREVSKTTPDAQAIIAADAKTMHGNVVRIIDTVKTNGVKSFAINIDKRAKGEL
jgi:biopolymer transport protein ExbD